MKGFILYSTYKVIDNKTTIQIFGRLENNESFVATFPFIPYFYIKESDLKKAKSLISKYETKKSKLKTFDNKKVVKILANVPTEISKLSTALHKSEVSTFEADLNPASRFLLDNDILSLLELKGDYQNTDKIDRHYDNPEIKSVPYENYKHNLKTIAIDIETNKDTGELFCIGLYGKNYKQCFIISDKKIANSVSCKDEFDLLENFKAELISQDPDIITGFHVIDFDLAHLRQRYAKNKISFDIGRTNDNIKLRIDPSFFRSSKADIPGRQVLDALNLIKDPFIKEAPTLKNAKFNSFTLEGVSQTLLGEGKLITGKDRYLKIEDYFKNNQKKLVDYNIQDCKLAYDILDKTKIIDLAIERSNLTGMPLNRITASIAAFDSLYIREANKRGLVSPTTHYRERGERITGGFVMNADAGIYHNLLVLDFKSLYPSIIKTFNIDPASFLDKKQKDAIMSPNNAYFKNTNGILPEIIEKLHKAREIAKKENREFASYAIKIIMNSFFGVLASPNCRYYSLDMANAITHFGQFLIKLTADEINKLGYDVIYSDTDSVFVKTNLNKAKANKLGKDIEVKINNFYNNYTKKNYNRKSYLELEFEKLYLAFMLPPIRGASTGSKKRYAGLIEKKGKEELIITGLEAIRGDWTDAAQEFQVQLLSKIFHKEEFVTYIKNYVKKLQDGKLDEKLVYTKSITKPLDEYTKTTPPHVKAARKLDKLESRTIKYFITIDGPEPVSKLKHKLDYEHYIKKQIAPIANTLLFFFDKDFDEIISTSKQMKLF